MGDQRLAFLRPAGQQLHQRRRNPCAIEELEQSLGHGGGLLARLEDDRIAGDQRRHDMAVGQVRGEIVGAEHRHHAVRLVAQRGLALQRAVELALPGPLGIGADRDLDLVDHRFHFGPRFPHGFAGLAGDQLGEFILFLAHLVGKAAHQLHPLGERLCCPLRPGAAGPRHRFIDIAMLAAP